ncbi:MAG: oligosaccharide repeat unit polymerase [Fibrobacterales bacterium]|nr:oligosaccharide repeat unit polymerase [Fibrobacterales bacterium]MBP5188846.1 oligosaccharide repeat unit polymerase [Fibrobacterales bacterium]
MASALLFAVCALCLLQSSVFKRDFFGPVSVYLFSQCLSLGIAWLRLTPQMTPWHAETWAVFAGSAVSFSLGCVCARLAWAARHPHEAIDRDAPSKELLAAANAGYRWKLHLVLTLCAFAYFLVGLAAEIKDMGAPMLLLPDLAKAMAKGGGPNIGRFVFPFSSAPMVCALCVVGCFKSMNPSRPLRVAFRALFAAAAVLGFVGLPNRISLFAVALTAAYVFDLACRRIRPAAILLGIAAAFALFFAVAQLKSQGVTMEGILTDKKMWELPYKYIANNWWNLDYAINRGNDEWTQPTLFGLDAAHGLVEPLPAVGRLHEVYNWDGIYNDRSIKTSTLNTMPYQWGLYKDFGMAGAVGIPFLVGLFLGTLHASVRARGRAGDVLLYSLLLFFVTFWFFEEFWFSFIYVSWVLAVLLVARVCTGRRRAEPAADPEKAALDQGP